MNKKIIFALIFIFCLQLDFFAQTIQYRAEREKKHQLQHTKLKVDFNFSNQTMNGEAWITASPYFYPSNSITLDAKTMLIHEVEMNGKKLNYNYENNNQLKINLPKTYQKEEEFTVYIKYTAQPEKVFQKGSNAITSAKGLYFINPLGIDTTKPTQIWTQGETEANSVWFPTIDAPNQKTSQEIYITVPKKYVTLSNGELISSTENGENRTDYWSFKQKHAPYLFFMGIGEYEIVKDAYKNIPVHYYVEKDYAPYAKAIFGNTPEMIGFFEKKLGVNYPWNKYHQIVGRDYVSGAMENTTAVIHGEHIYQMPGQLIDENTGENTIAHELFHHWFGDLVTSESWSNLTLNESFANYSEYLWQDYKYGKEAAEMHAYNNINAYFNGQSDTKNLVRFDYADKEDMFDLVSYNKGGAILHMLRNFVGDEAFFLSLTTYLERFKYKTAEVHQLRLVFEEITGKDLNWFFNQWFYGNGHPEINISYDYNTLRKTVTINVYQTQAKPFQFPFTIDVFEGNKPVRHTFFVEGRDASFTVPYKKQPNLIQVNADGVLVCKINENNILSESVFRLKNADHFSHRLEALLQIAAKQDDKTAFNAIVDALDDKAYKIRIAALENIDLSNKFSKRDAISKIIKIAQNDEKTLVQAAAISTLGKLTDPELKSIFEKAMQNQSYSVLGNALVGLYYIDKPLAIKKSKELPDAAKKYIATPLTRIFIEENDEKELPFIAKNVLTGMFLTNDEQTKSLYQKAFKIISNTNNTEAIKNLTNDMVEKGLQYKSFDFDKVVINLMRTMIQSQETSSNSNKSLNVEVIKKAMTKLL